MVLISKLNKRKVYQELLKDGYQFQLGVCVIEKNWTVKQHPTIKGIPNLQIWMLLRSMKDRDLVQLVFNWNHFYFFLKKEGIQYLNKQLGFTESITPNTHQQTGRNYISDLKGKKPMPKGPSGGQRQIKPGYGGYGSGRGRGRGRGMAKQTKQQTTVQQKKQQDIKNDS